MTDAYVVGIGGTLREGSATERVIRRVLDHAEALGARVALFAGPAIDLPMFTPGSREGEGAIERADRLVAALRASTAIVIGSPAYHGALSGLVKNALDYAEWMASDSDPYFSRRPVGCVATGAGWQGCNAALQGLRGIVHALRGWPTPLGIALNTATPLFAADGSCLEPRLEAQLRLMAGELVAPDPFRSALAAPG